MSVTRKAGRVSRFAAVAGAAALFSMFAAASPSFAQTIEAWVDATDSSTMTEAMDESVIFNANFQLTRPDAEEDFHPSVSTTITIGGTFESGGYAPDFSGCISQTASYTFDYWEKTAMMPKTSEVIVCSIEDSATSTLLDDNMYEKSETVTITPSNVRCTANCSSATTQFRNKSGASAGDVLAMATFEDGETNCCSIEDVS